MKTRKINSNCILKYFALGFACLILAQAQLSGISPFLYAFYFACLFVSVDAKLISALTLIGGMSTGFSLQNFLINISVVAIGLICIYIHKFSKRKIHLVTIFFAYLFSNITYVYYNFVRYKHLIAFLLLGLICLFVYIVVLQVMFLRKNCFKLTLDESVCFLFAITSLGLGLSTIFIFDFSLLRFFIVFVLLVCVAIGSPSLTYSITLSFALGCALCEQSLIPVAEFVLLGLLSSVFSMPNKFKIVFMVIISDVFIQYFFILKSIDILISVVPVALACLVFVLLPNKMLNSLTDIVYVKKSEITSRNVINTTRKNIKKRMVELSNVFLDMKNIHLNMTKKELSKEELVAMLTREILSTSCKFNFVNLN